MTRRSRPLFVISVAALIEGRRFSATGLHWGIPEGLSRKAAEQATTETSAGGGMAESLYAH
jgi:hypothetical protein